MLYAGPFDYNLLWKNVMTYHMLSMLDDCYSNPSDLMAMMLVITILISLSTVVKILKEFRTF